ncbi:glycosyltransferase family 8 protein [Hoeflea sp.]|uniref:glycosyltransferase family 8 protein n=1 Tax=Hoeflea sp. TaxID=1940281 RepID=UPI003B01B249
MNIVVAVDNKVAAPACVLLNSLKLNNAHEDICVHLLWCDLTDQKLDTIREFASTIGLELRTYRLDISEAHAVFGKLPNKSLTPTCLLCCLAGEALPEEIDRVLYLDTDIIVAGSVSELYHSPLIGNIIGAVRNPGVRHLEEFGGAEDDYFNSGVMLIDLGKWRSEATGEMTLGFLRKHPDKCVHADQCALNVTLSGKVLYLDNRWNVMGCLEERIETTNVSIIHYAGGPKPWHDPERHPYGIHYCNYSRTTPWPTRYRFKKLRPGNPAIFRARRIAEKNTMRLRSALRRMGRNGAAG